MDNKVEVRKLEHIFICNHCDVEYKKGTLLDNVKLIHRGTSNCNLMDIDTSIKLFNKYLSAPIIVCAITGGHTKAKEINKNIAIAIEELNLGMGVGSQRAGIINKELVDTYSVVRDYTDNLVIGNLGAVNFVMDNWNEDIIEDAVSMIDADCMAIHFNPLQEAIQPEGDVNFKNITILKEVITNYKRKYKNIPFMAKQVGEGFSKEDGKILKDIGFDCIDVGGSGGTSWALVEYYRIGNEEYKDFSKRFLEWGIPTAASILEVRKVYDRLVIGSGGVRTGMDVAKTLLLGADCSGLALPVLRAALKGPDKVIKLLEKIIKELKTTMFLLGCENINTLKKDGRYIITGELKDWL